jgi:repressor LexA
MSPAPLGTTRERVFLFVRERLLAGDPPTVRDVQDAFSFRTPQTARYHLEKLVAEGRLLAARGKARGYRLLEQLDLSSPTRWVPVLGRVQAGQLTTATQELDGYIPMPAGRTRRDHDHHGRHGHQAEHDDLFALRVQGESMTGAGIFPGDLVIVRRQPTADSGALVVALVDDEATVKRLRLRDGQVELHPENPDFEPIHTDREITLLGKVIEVRRALE